MSQKTEYSYTFSAQSLVVKVIKYLIEGLAVAVAAYYFPKNRLALDDVFVIGCTAAAIFAILDLFSPSTGASARLGAGFGIGAAQVGFMPRL